ncbi:MAG: UV DNA damage repair endonuclease UvsE [Desulfuromonadaceae bacterium]|nr:UV DNA damage repair endonuclease UvsE [Desulfuromonadaceae bacterium]MDD2856092.1 UV DNA damage repair endonuclease UvsE [Desulfuromonadaceae bacterium]
MRLGLCCLFKKEQVSFRTTTAKALSAMPRGEQLVKLSGICTHNTKNLLLALKTVSRLGIGSFRIMSPLFPRMTHPVVGYQLGDLPENRLITETFEQVRRFSLNCDIRLSFHPDQFVVLSSPHAAVVDNSIMELNYQAMLAESVGAEVINIHVGGVYGDKLSALERFCSVFQSLPLAVRSRLTLENDDISYTVRDLLPVCEKLSIPLVYDVHHHRCNPDGLTVEEATILAGETWERVGREQYCHISSPKSGWGGGNLKPHADYIDTADLPECWLGREMTVDVEAKEKELAVVKLLTYLQGTD